MEDSQKSHQRSSSSRKAVIDIGTNSVKILLADVSGHDISPVLEDSEQTRLGRGFYQTHVLQKSAISHTAGAVAAFAAKAKELGARNIRVIATSAARDAKNGSELVGAIEKASGLRVEIISGQQEADWAFQGVCSNAELARHPMLILDVGGGSTEFILGEKGHARFRESFNLGTVRLLEQLPISNPPTPAELDDARAWVTHFLQEKVAPDLRPALAQGSGKEVQLVGTGGTSTILARIENGMEDYNRECIEATRLSRRRIRQMAEWLWGMALEQRKQVVGLPKKRADVILFGAVIYEKVMEELEFTNLRISTRGLRYAALM